MSSILRFSHHSLVSTELTEVMHPIKNSLSLYFHLHSSLLSYLGFSTGKHWQNGSTCDILSISLLELGICLCHVDSHICPNLCLILSCKVDSSTFLKFCNSHPSLPLEVLLLFSINMGSPLCSTFGLSLTASSPSFDFNSNFNI